MLVYALMDQQVFWGQEVRQYPLLLLWLLASSWFLLRWMKAQGRGALPFGLATAYTLSVIGGLYTHSFMGLVILAQLLFVMARLPRQHWLRYGSLLALAGVAFLPWGAAFVYQFQVHGGLRHDWPLNGRTLEILTTHFLGSPVALPLGLIVLALVRPWVAAPGWRRPPPMPGGLLLPVLGIGVPIALVIALTLFSENTRLLTDRNLAILLPWLAVLVALGLSAFEPFGRAVLVGLFILNGLATTDVAADNPPWPEVAAFLALRRGGGGRGYRGCFWR
ncbi:MAG: hypothetical protein HC915_14970 [Anaerolineae bacterium]|nr:hypothetical protein [Anaerolineae bacterium]